MFKCSCVPASLLYATQPHETFLNSFVIGFELSLGFSSSTQMYGGRRVKTVKRAAITQPQKTTASYQSSAKEKCSSIYMFAVRFVFDACLHLSVTIQMCCSYVTSSLPAFGTLDMNIPLCRETYTGGCLLRLYPKASLLHHCFDVTIFTSRNSCSIFINKNREWIGSRLGERLL
ncbi:hypothetical protein CHARACLAT_024751 [Characodon lateralis]|uniref:Uncharacterized protein n=1 Tax=Characodon lateralis TaxID=208331 RepID=A0ABU7EMJ6_9TELE|nr:hypothetical protein [Characodon lateralis]